MSVAGWSELSAIATALAALTTVGVLILNCYYVTKFTASIELQSTSLEIQRKTAETQHKTAQGSILLQINRDFFYQEPHKKIIDLLENGRGLSSAGVSETEMDDHIGMLDTIGTFLKAGILDNKEWVWALFSHYVESAYECEEIAEYVKYCQENISKTLFEDFVWLYNELKPLSISHEPKESVPLAKLGP
jgi:hypothetical protein